MKDFLDRSGIEHVMHCPRCVKNLVRSPAVSGFKDGHRMPMDTRS